MIRGAGSACEPPSGAQSGRRPEAHRRHADQDDGGDGSARNMFAHADETDDFEPQTKAHPGCAVVPAAVAVAERHDRSGQELIRSVALGYDLCCRWLMALGPAHVRATHRSAEGVSATFGAAAAAASLAQLDEQGMRYTLSYAAQQVSGVWSC
jgi:2-methylcitrate dehydratase PrpD